MLNWAKLKTAPTVMAGAVVVAMAVTLLIHRATAEEKSPPVVSSETKAGRKHLETVQRLVRPGSTEPCALLASINWETDPWKAAVRAAKEGKPILTYGGSSGVPCGYG